MFGVTSARKPTTWIGSDGVIYHDLTGFSRLSLELVKYLYSQRLRLSAKGPHRVVVLAPDILTVEFEVQLFASNPAMLRSVAAMAIVGQAFMVRHLTSMFLSYHAPGYPVRLFDSIHDATEWLQGQPIQQQLG
ncbi:MAG: hypothetical protein IBX52_07025 [Bacterioplanes sp.]|nr:hypothetical protein [Bacterioplanes sp.]